MEEQTNNIKVQDTEGNSNNHSDKEIKVLEGRLKSLRAEKYKKLDLVKTDREGIKEGIKKDGRKYSVRDNRSRFFYPSEWMKFFDALIKKQKFTFKFLMLAI